ncbi:MAG: hypothetical protein V3U96_00375 [Paracoccaceae bacterium]
MEEFYDYIIVDYDPVTGECEPVHPSAISEPPNTLPRHLRRKWKTIFKKIQPVVGNYDAYQAASLAIERDLLRHR